MFEIAIISTQLPAPSTALSGESHFRAERLSATPCLTLHCGLDPLPRGATLRSVLDTTSRSAVTSRRTARRFDGSAYQHDGLVSRRYRGQFSAALHRRGSTDALSTPREVPRDIDLMSLRTYD